MDKHSKASSSTKWRLGENVALRLMEYLTPTVSYDAFIGNYFTSFFLLTHLGVNNLRATHMLNENRLHKWNITGDEQLLKKGTQPL